MKKKIIMFSVLFIFINTIRMYSTEEGIIPCVEERIVSFYDSIVVEDTIDFATGRVFISVPQLSVKMSREQIIEGHGKSIYYPLKYTLNNHGNWRMQVLFIEYISMSSYDRFIHNDSIDIELWNSFPCMNRGGSRCYLNDGVYTRIDILDPGIVIYYENLEPEIAAVANRIIDTVNISQNRDIPIFNVKKKLPDIEY